MKLQTCFWNVNSKQGLAKWLYVFINLLDNIILSFRKLHHTMLSQHCWNTPFPICHPPFGGKIWYIFWYTIQPSHIFGINFGNLLFAWWEITFHYCFCLHFSYYQVGLTFLPDFWVIFLFFFLGNLYFVVFFCTSQFSSIALFIFFSYFNVGLCINEVNESFVSYLPNIYQLSFSNSVFIVYSAMQEVYYKESYVNFPF